MEISRCGPDPVWRIVWFGCSAPDQTRERRAEMTEEADLIRRAVDGEEAAWVELVHRYESLLRSVGVQFRLTGSDVDDAAQTTWLALFRNINKVTTPEALAGWLATTMRRNCLRILHQRRREQPAEECADWVVADLTVDIDDRLERTQRRRLLRESVDRLPPRQRDLVRALSAPGRLSYEEIAKATAMPVGAIGPTRQRALGRLRSMLTDGAEPAGGAEPTRCRRQLGCGDDGRSNTPGQCRKPATAGCTSAVPSRFR
jgi:RNA polymerase sigma factor (sigma-70 family)